MKTTKRELSFKVWRALLKTLLLYGKDYNFNKVDYITILTFLVDTFLRSMAETDENRSYEDYVKIFAESLMMMNNDSNPDKKES